MKVLSIKLESHTEEPSKVFVPAGTVVHEPQPGFIRKVQLCGEGLLIVHGPSAALIPLDQLLAAADLADPSLAPDAPPIIT